MAPYYLAIADNFYIKFDIVVIINKIIFFIKNIS